MRKANNDDGGATSTNLEKVQAELALRKKKTSPKPVIPLGQGRLVNNDNMMRPAQPPQVVDATITKKTDPVKKVSDKLQRPAAQQAQDVSPGIEKMKSFFGGIWDKITDHDGQTERDVRDLEKEGARQKIYSDVVGSPDRKQNTLKQIQEEVARIEAEKIDLAEFDKVPSYIKANPLTAAALQYMNGEEDNAIKTLVWQKIDESEDRLKPFLYGAAESFMSIIPTLFGIAGGTASLLGQEDDAKGIDHIRKKLVKSINKPVDEAIADLGPGAQQYREYGAAAETLGEFAVTLGAISVMKNSPSVLAKLSRAGTGATRRQNLRVLGLADNATDAQIKKAYLKKAKELHPHKTKNPNKAQSAAEFSEANKAYKGLLDPKHADDLAKLDTEIMEVGKNIDPRTGEWVDPVGKFAKEMGEVGSVSAYLNMKEEFVMDDPEFKRFLQNTFADTAHAMAFFKVMEGGIAAYRVAPRAMKKEFSRVQEAWKRMPKYNVEFDPNRMGTFGGNVKFTAQKPMTKKSVEPQSIQPTPEKKGKFFHGGSTARLAELDAGFAFADIAAGKQNLGSVAAEGPGLYFTTSETEALGYGDTVMSLDPKSEANIVTTESAPLSEETIREILSKVDPETLETAASNWSEDYQGLDSAGVNSIVEEIMAGENPHEQMISIWADVYTWQDPNQFLDAVSASGIDGVMVQKPESEHLIIYNKDAFVEPAFDDKIPLDDKNKFMSGGRETTPGDISQKAVEKRDATTIEFESFALKNLSDQFSAATGKKITEETLRKEFVRMKVAKRVQSMDEFIVEAEKKLATMEQNAKAAAEKEAAEDVVMTTPEIDAEIKAMVQSPMNIARAADLKPSSNEDAIEKLLEVDPSAKGIVEKFDDLELEARESGLDLDAADLFDYFQIELARSGPIAARKPGVQLKRVPKDATAEQRALVQAENQLTIAERKISRSQELIDSLKTRPTETRQLRDRIKQFDKGYKIGKAETKTDLKILKKDLAAYARKYIPPFELRKSEISPIMTKIAELETPVELRAAVRKVNEIADKAIRRMLGSRIEKTLKKTKVKKQNGITKGKFTPEAQEFFDKAREASKLDMADAQEKIDKNIRDIISGEGDPGKLVAENQALQFSGLKDRNSAELIELNRTLDDTISGAREDRAAATREAKERRQLISDAVNNSVGGWGNAGGESGLARGLEKDDGRLDFLSDLDNAMSSLLILTDKASRHDITTQPDRSPLSMLADQIRTAGIAGNMLAIDFTIELQEQLKIAAPGKSARKKLEKLGEQQTVGKFTDLNGDTVKIEMSPMEAGHFYQTMKDPESAEIIRSSDVTDPETGRVHRVGNAYTDEMVEAVIAIVPDELKKVADWMQDSLYPSVREKIVPVYESKYGVKFPENPNYVPRATEKGLQQTTEQMLMDEQKSFGGVPSATKSRVKHKKPLVFKNMIGVGMKHVNDMTHFVAHAEAVGDMRSVIANESFRALVRQQPGGSSLLTELENSLTAVAGGNLQYDVDAKFFDRAIGKWVQASTVANLGLNPAVFLKQLTSFPAYLAEVPLKPFIEGTADFWTNPVKKFNILMESDFMKQRYEKGFERDIVDATKGSAVQDALGTKRLSDKMMGLVKLGDKFAIIQGGWSLYRHLRNQGMSHPDALNEFSRVSQNAQQESAIWSRNSIQRKKGPWKALTNYMTSPMQYYQQFMKWMRAYKHKRGSMLAPEGYEDLMKKTLRHEATPDQFEEMRGMMGEDLKSNPNYKKLERKYERGMFTYAVLLPVVYQFMNDGMKVKLRSMLAALTSVVSAIPVVGPLVKEFTAAVLTGKKKMYDYSVPAISSANDVARMLMSVYKAILDDDLTEKEAQTLIKNATRGLGPISRLPLYPAYRSLSGAYELAAGKTKDWRRLAWSEAVLGSTKDLFYEELKKNGPTPAAIRMFSDLKKNGEYARGTKLTTIIKQRRKAGQVGKKKPLTAAEKRANIEAEIKRRGLK